MLRNLLPPLHFRGKKLHLLLLYIYQIKISFYTLQSALLLLYNKMHCCPNI